MLTDERMDDGRKVITIAHPEHSSGELIIMIKRNTIELFTNNANSVEMNPKTSLKQLQNTIETNPNNNDIMCRVAVVLEQVDCYLHSRCKFCANYQ